MFRKDYHWTWPLPVRVLITLSNQTFSSLKNSYKIAFFLIDLWTFGATLSMSISNLEWAKCPCHSTILQMGSMAKKFIKRKHIMIIKSRRLRPCWRPAIWSVGCRNTRMATSTRFHCNRWVAKVFFVESVIGENRTTCGQTSVNISRQLRRRILRSMLLRPFGWMTVLYARSCRIEVTQVTYLLIILGNSPQAVRNSCPYHRKTNSNWQRT